MTFARKNQYVARKFNNNSFSKMEISMRKRTLTVVEAVPEIRLDRLLHRVAQRLYCFTATGSRRPWRGACRRAATVALRQTSRYMTAAIMKAVSASNAECRLMNMVDRMMEMHKYQLSLDKFVPPI